MKMEPIHESFRDVPIKSPLKEDTLLSLIIIVFALLGLTMCMIAG